MAGWLELWVHSGRWYLQDLLESGGLLGQMGTLRLKTVLVGHKVNGVGLAIGSHPGDGSPNGYGFVVGARVVDHALLCSTGAIAQFVAELVAAEAGVLRFVLKNFHIILRPGTGQGQEKGYRAND